MPRFRTPAQRIRDVIDLLESAEASNDCSILEEAIEELKALADELDEE
ncbi:MAG: hypothetical protein QXP31_03020 [Pyrobaculum sp.]